MFNATYITCIDQQSVVEGKIGGIVGGEVESEGFTHGGEELAEPSHGDEGGSIRSDQSISPVKIHLSKDNRKKKKEREQESRVGCYWLLWVTKNDEEWCLLAGLISVMHGCEQLRKIDKDESTCVRSPRDV